MVIRLLVASNVVGSSLGLQAPGRVHQPIILFHPTLVQIRKGDGVQHDKHSAQHNGATRNAPMQGLGFQAKGTETRRRATMEPKGKATARREKEEGEETMKPNGKVSRIPL